MANSYNSGGWFLAGGICVSVIGLVLTGTGIGALCGLPLIFFVGLPLEIFGIAQMRKAREIPVNQSYYAPPRQINAGIRQSERIFCRKCGFNNNLNSKFCYACGENLLMNGSEDRRPL